MRKILNYGFLFILAVMSLVLVSCDKVKASDLINSVLVDQDSYVDADFFVIGEIKHEEEVYPITWTSSDACLTVSETKNELGYYTVKVTRPEDTDKTITLTATLTISRNNKASKDFEFRVYPIDVYDILDNFKFESDGAKVTGGEEIELPTTATYAGKTATIAWTTESELVTIGEDGDTATFATVSKDTPTVLTATFTYKGKTSSMNYEVIISRFMTEHEKLIEWYENSGVAQTLSGYVVEIATEYSESYGNVSLYIINDTFTGGYYLYRVKVDANEAKQLKVGAHVTAKGTTNTSYSGLMETNAGGELVVDEDVEEINVKDHIYAMDNDYIANAQSLYYRTSTLVSVTGWKVTKVTALSTDSNPAKILELEKDGVKLSVVYSKYVASTPLNKDNEVYKAVDAKLATLEVGNFVDVTGVLSYYNKANTKYDQKSYQVMIQNADSIVKNESAAEVTNTDAKKVGNAIKAFAGFKPIYTKDCEIALPATQGEATISWAFHNNGHTGVEFKDEAKSALTVTAGGYSFISLDATFKCGEYETVVYYSFIVEKLSDADIVKRAADEVELKAEYAAGEYDLPTDNEIFEDVEYSYTVVSGPAIVDGDTLVVLTPQETTRVVLEVTATQGEASATAKVRFDALSSDVYVVVEEREEGKGYKLGLYQENLGKTLLITGEMDGYYYGTTTNGAEAVDVYLEAIPETETYYMYFEVKEAKKYLNIILNGTYTNVVFEDAASSVWTYNTEHNTFTTVLGEDTFFLGTNSSGTYSTLSACKESKFDSSFIAHFYQVAKLTEEYAVDYELGRIDLDENLVVGEYDIVTVPSLYDTEITYTIVEGEDIATIVDGKLVLATDLKEATVKIKVEVAAGEVSKTKEFTINVFNITYAMTSYFEVGVPYKLGFIHTNLENKEFFLTGEIANHYATTVEVAANGTDFYLEEATNGYYIYFNNGTKKYANLVISGTYVNILFEATASTVWNVDNNLGTMVGKASNGTLYCLGTSNSKTYKTVGPVKVTSASYNCIVKFYKALAQNECTIAEAFVAEKGTPVVINGNVVAVSAKGFVLWDGTDAVYVYANAVPTVAVGDFAEVNGKMDNYKGNIQVSNVQVKKLATGKEFSGEVLAVSGADMDSYVAATTWDAMYVEVTGTLAISGSYYNVTVEGAATAQGSIYQITDAVKAEVTAGTVTLRGWAIGVSSGKYCNMIVTDVVTADEEKVVVAKALENVNAAVLSKNLTLPTTAAGYELTWEDAEGNAITEITFVAGAKVKATAKFTFNGQVTTVGEYEFECAAPITETVTATLNIGTYATANSWVNQTKYTSIQLDENVTVSCTGGDNTGKYYTSGNQWRIYQTENPTITISSERTIVSVKITYNVEKGGVLVLNSKNITSGTVVEVNANTITFSVGNSGSATNGQARITAIEVVYAA